MSKTPRTDEREFAAIDLKPSARVVYASFARQLETELANSEKKVFAYKTALEQSESELADARAEIERKNALIEQLKNCYNCKFELHAAKECETCNTADCDDSRHYETSNWQPKEPEAAERLTHETPDK